GPVISGQIMTETGQVSAMMRGFRFGRDIRTMLPAQVRQWWQDHQLAGQIDIPELTYTPGRDGRPASFRVKTALAGVQLTVRPEQWRGDRENRRIESFTWLVGLLQHCHGAGARYSPGPDGRRGDVLNPTVFDQFAGMFESAPITLKDVSGAFVFTEDGIDVEDVAGRVETNSVQIKGRIDGYSPHAPAHVLIWSSSIHIPGSPRYVRSLPQPVRELYDRLRPEGRCTFWLDLRRPEEGAKLDCRGEIDIVDGSFVFDRFPYPLRQATGRIVLTKDSETGLDLLRIENLRGLGLADGPNADSFVTVHGWIGPLTNEAGVTIKVAGDRVTSEPALRAAFPREVRQALRYLDAEGRGDYPQFSGSFVCDIVRPIGVSQPWTVDTDIILKDASGALVAFPYPLSGVTGKLQIREGYVDIVNAAMNRGDASLVIDGRVTWAQPDPLRRHRRLRDPASESAADRAVTTLPASDDGTSPAVPLFPELKVTARNVPVDKDLLAALPADRRVWLE
ncbi:MAG: hypothetical protein ACREIT_12560, partial [Tepidisphaeraceae bacterium]